MKITLNRETLQAIRSAANAHCHCTWNEWEGRCWSQLKFAADAVDAMLARKETAQIVPGTVEMTAGTAAVSIGGIDLAIAELEQVKVDHHGQDDALVAIGIIRLTKLREKAVNAAG